MHSETPQSPSMQKVQQLQMCTPADTCRFGSSGCAAARSFLVAMALPFDETAPDGSKASLPPVKEKNRGGRPRNNAASIIYASALQQSLATLATAPPQH